MIVSVEVNYKFGDIVHELLPAVPLAEPYAVDLLGPTVPEVRYHRVTPLLFLNYVEVLVLARTYL